MLEVLSVLEKLDVPFGKWKQDIAALREAKSLAAIVRLEKGLIGSPYHLLPSP
jgi:hypothetical protein